MRSKEREHNFRRLATRLATRLSSISSLHDEAFNEEKLLAKDFIIFCEAQYGTANGHNLSSDPLRGTTLGITMIRRFLGVDVDEFNSTEVKTQRLPQETPSLFRRGLADGLGTA